jgi:aminoglycoside 3-N-acetyltransferase
MWSGNKIKYYIKLWGKRYLPRSVIDTARKPFRLYRTKKRAAYRKTAEPLTIERLIADLKTAGIAAGDVVMVHSSLSKIGNVDGGPKTVTESFIDLLTPDGTLIMPCYNSAEVMLKDLRHGKLIDLRTSPSLTGKITEVFRTRPDTIRSSHPFSSSCAWGKWAEHITSGHALDHQVCHAESPVGRLLGLKGRIVGIGIPIAQGLGVAHYLEDTWDGFPFEVHTPLFPVKYIDGQGNIIERQICRFDPDVARTRIDYPEGAWICEKLTEHLQRTGIYKSFRYGEAQSWIMESVDLYNELKRLASKGVTMYLTPERLTDQNRDIENW